MLPGVVMAKGGEVFDKLYQLTELDDPKSVTFTSFLNLLFAGMSDLGPDWQKMEYIWDFISFHYILACQAKIY